MIDLRADGEDLLPDCLAYNDSAPYDCVKCGGGTALEDGACVNICDQNNDIFRVGLKNGNNQTVQFWEENVCEKDGDNAEDVVCEVKTVSTNVTNQTIQ